jgi:hypothetical protein
VLLDFPVVQYSVGLLPWLVSIWVGEPWKLALWAVGIGLDLLVILVLSGSDILRRAQTYVAVPLLLGAFATHVSGRTLVVCLALVVLAHLFFERRSAPVNPET